MTRDERISKIVIDAFFNNIGVYKKRQRRKIYGLLMMKQKTYKQIAHMIDRKQHIIRDLYEISSAVDPDKNYLSQ